MTNKPYYIKTTNKAEFLKSERNDDVYWLQFSYAEYLRVMSGDATKCKCGIYYWKGCKRRCGCER